MRNNFSELSSIFGYCPQFDAIFEYMTVFENLEFYGKIKGIKKEYLNDVINAMIEEMSLSEFTNKIAGRLSGGNKRKLSVAISFLCTPPIVLLDEPSTGMDPEARRFMWSVIHKMSSKGKKASIIMTTHSMDEAETLCKRMAIMINGEFVCLGSSSQIKEKYGYGYEIEVRIKPLSEKKFEKLLLNKIDKNLKINMDNINEILTELNEKEFINELKKGRLGSRLIRDIQMNNFIPIRALISWVFFVKNALLFIKNAMKYFEQIILTEHIDNNFLFKMKKNSNTKSIGFFFGLFENNKESCSVTEYSIQQTSLEQIFNLFEDKYKKSNNNEKNNDIIEQDQKEEILIDNDIFNLCYN
jgi:ATP-binding cassette subfamily A (ABC1) protein 3